VIAALATDAGWNWSPDDALAEILRGRLEGLGPVSESALAAALGLEPAAIATSSAS
jgi:ATP-dependent Lhr-like helicase